MAKKLTAEELIWRAVELEGVDYCRGLLAGAERQLRIDHDSAQTTLEGLTGDSLDDDAKDG